MPWIVFDINTLEPISESPKNFGQAVMAAMEVFLEWASTNLPPNANIGYPEMGAEYPEGTIVPTLVAWHPGVVLTCQGIPVVGFADSRDSMREYLGISGRPIPAWLS